MGHDPLERFPDTSGFGAYDRQSVDRFFVAAFEARGRLLGALAHARRRISEAEAALAEAADDEFQAVQSVLEGQRLLREEVRANERAVAAVAANAEAEAVRILTSARARAAIKSGERQSGHGSAGYNGVAPDVDGMASRRFLK